MGSNSNGIPADGLFLGSPAVPQPAEAERIQETEQPCRVGPQPIANNELIRDAGGQTDDLLLRIQHQDSQALAVLFEKYCRLVFTIGNRVLRSRTEAEDLVQDVFLFLWTRSGLFVPGNRSGHDWIIRVIYHRAFDRRRYLMTRLAYNSRVQRESACYDKQDEREDRSSRLVSKEENFGEQLYWHSYLEAAFEELSKDQRKTLELFFFEGFTLAEIGKELGQSLMNVRNYYYRGLRKLSRRVANGGRKS